MKNKKRTLKRITALYVTFFAVIIISIILSFNSTAFKDGFKAGRSDAERVINDRGRVNTVAQISYGVQGVSKSLEFDEPVYSNDDNSVKVASRPSSLDVKIVTPSGVRWLSMSIIFGVLSVFAYVAIFVIIFMILNSLRRSIKTGDLFEKRNILRTRIIGILLIFGSLLSSLMSWLEVREIAPFFAESDFSVITSFPFQFGDIIIGVLLFFVAEIFAIGYSLSEEGKLTI